MTSNTTNALQDIEDAIVLAGAGKMGGALLSGWLAQGLDGKRVVVIEPHPSDEISALVTKGVRLDPSPKDIGAIATLVIALKPQSFREAGAMLKSFTGPSTLVVSIMAGTTIASISEVCGGSVVRAMPNTPAAIGRAITVACANPRATPGQRRLCEALLDPVTAVSGSGPAYVFLVIEALAAAGERVGLPPDLALRLARETVAGAGELARLSPDSPARLRENVTSPGGTTRAALDVLMADDGLARLLERAVAAATLRSRELAS